MYVLGFFVCLFIFLSTVYQTFHFILKEEYIRENCFISKKATETLELAADSINYSSKMNDKDYHIFLMLQLESLLLNEENLLFFQNNLKLISPEIYQHGYVFMYSLLLLIEASLPNNKEKAAITSTKAYLESKIKSFNNSDYDIKDQINM